MLEKEILNGRYQLNENLGTGGMAVVYSAQGFDAGTYGSHQNLARRFFF